MISISLKSVLRNATPVSESAESPRRHFTAGLIALCVVAWSPQVAADHSWGNYHWGRTSNPFTLQLGDNLSGDWGSFLVTTSADWSASSVLDTVIVSGGTTAKRCRATGGRVEVCNSRYGKNGWLGLAQIWISGGHITQGYTKVNDTYFGTAKYNKPEWKNLVMCQEVGHTLGLNHQDENFSNVPLGTCMDYSSNPDPNQYPDQHDYDQLETIYAHLDGTTTAGQTTSKNGRMPPAMTDIEFETPAQWGRLVRSLNRGLREVYELDFGGGNKVFTFVIWAEDSPRADH